MQPSPWISCLHFYQQPPADRLELLITRRKLLFEQEQRLLAHQATVSQRQHQLIVQQTVHEMQCRLFWLQLKHPELVRQEDETETTPALEDPSDLNASPQLVC